MNNESPRDFPGHEHFEGDYASLPFSLPPLLPDAKRLGLAVLSGIITAAGADQLRRGRKKTGTAGISAGILGLAASIYQPGEQIYYPSERTSVRVHRPFDMKVEAVAYAATDVLDRIDRVARGAGNLTRDFIDFFYSQDPNEHLDPALGESTQRVAHDIDAMKPFIKRSESPQGYYATLATPLSRPTPPRG